MCGGGADARCHPLLLSGHRAQGSSSTHLTVLGLRAAPGFYMGAENLNSDPGSGRMHRTDRAVPSGKPHMLFQLFVALFFLPILILQINNTEHQEITTLPRLIILQLTYFFQRPRYHIVSISREKPSALNGDAM